MPADTPNTPSPANSAVEKNPEEITRVCNTCATEQPMANFRRRGRNSSDRQHECNACRNHRECRNRARKRGEDISQWSTTVRETENFKTVIALTSTMIKRFGGVSNFAGKWKEQIDNAPVGSKQALDGFRTIHHMMRVLMEKAEKEEAKQAEKPDYTELSDGELERLILNALGQTKGSSNTSTRRKTKRAKRVD